MHEGPRWRPPSAETQRKALRQQMAAHLTAEQWAELRRLCAIAKQHVHGPHEIFATHDQRAARYATSCLETAEITPDSFWLLTIIHDIQQEDRHA